MQLQWHIDTTASTLHAAAAVASGRRLADGRVGAVIEAALSRLSAALAPANVSTAEFLHAAIPISRKHTAADGLVRAALASLGHDDIDATLAGVLVEAVDDLTNEMLLASPGMGEQLALRMVPLREAWDARGPGFWKALRQTVGINVASHDIAAADVLCVQPVLGGGGDAFPSQRVVTIEAVLANEHFQLPEVVRLGWLLAQLSCRHDESDIRKPELVLVTAVLKAAEVVELARCDPPTIRLALDAWHLSDDTAEQS